ncbi:MAG: protein translocase subunit SecF [Clostridia bacterium]|nr:protein translocase subunit SecF [Clostridia bacterium]
MFSPTAKRKIFFTISAVLVALSIILLFVRGLNFGIDFTGGNSIEIDMKKEIKNFSEVEETVEDIVKSQTKADNVIVQKTGSSGISIKTTEISNEESDAVVNEIKKKFSLSDENIISNEKVSAAVSGRLIADSLKAIFIAIILMLIYITIRFDLQSGASAVLALTHDVLIMLGFYALFGLTVNTSFIAAILTILGYSINATIVVFDRVRENNRTMRKASFDAIADDAIKSSYFRAINSSLTTLFTIGVLYVMGVASIREFALPIIVGIVAGTYSSLFIAGPFWAWWKNLSAKKNAAYTAKKKA